ncbi:MAG: PQQ-binding-like beta-propeller repeat protein, partial [Gemmataceae bacterium]|nr:PQQ-binding-like beta-propeller repeat protein [Gemmataceae bacterium]
RWERQFAATGGTNCHPDTNMAAPTPVTDGKAVYALFATGDAAAISKEGDLLWYRSLAGDYPDITNQVGMASSPVLAAGVLCVPMDNASDSFAAGLDAKTGKNLWKRKRPKHINWMTPAVVPGDKPAFVFLGEGDAIAYDARTGKEAWKLDLKGASSIPSPMFSEGVLYLPVGGGFGPCTWNAYKLEDGKPKELWSVKNTSAGYPSSAASGGWLYGLAGDIVTCLDAAEGKEKWRVRVQGPFEASPVVADGKLYCVNKKGMAFVVELGDKGKVVERNDLADVIQATPAVANGCVYLRSDKALWCLGPKKE